MPQCEYEGCREPFNQDAYVTTASDELYCLSCFLIFDRGVDPEEVADICFQGGRKDSDGR